MFQGKHYMWATIAGVVIVINGIIQAVGGNTALAVASILIGAGAIAVGIIKPGGGGPRGPAEPPGKDHD